MKTIDIKGKNYVEVNERIKFFRSRYEGWALTSEIISLENGVCIIKAEVKDDKDRVRATGIAYEKEGSSFINKTSYIENCETSAWGRALGNFGIGIDASIASADEVQNAIKNQKKELKRDTKDWKNAIEKLSNLSIDIDTIRDYYNIRESDENYLADIYNTAFEAHEIKKEITTK